MEKKQLTGLIHQNLREARKQKGYSQAELAELMNVSRQTVSNWETGLNIPDVVTLHRLHQQLDIPIEQLLGDEAVQEALETKQDLSDHEIVKQLAKMTAFYAAEIERRKMMERKVLIVICTGILLCLAVLLAIKFYFYPSQIVIQPIIETTQHMGNP